jgi:transcriptional regulatory protein LevR
MTNTQQKIDELKKTLAELEHYLNYELMEEIFLDLIKKLC